MNFKGRHFKSDLILQCVRWYCSYALSYRDIEEMMGERGVSVDHSTLQRWVVKYAPQLEKRFRKKKRPTVGNWFMDETYIKVKGKWTYYYRAVDKQGHTLDFLLCAKRDKKAALRFFKKMLGSSGLPDKVTIDKSGSNRSALVHLNSLLVKLGLLKKAIQIRQSKYMNNRIEQDHRGIKKIVRPMMGFKSFHSAQATLKGIELHRMLKKGQSILSNQCPVWEQWRQLAG